MISKRGLENPPPPSSDDEVTGSTSVIPALHAKPPKHLAIVTLGDPQTGEKIEEYFSGETLPGDDSWGEEPIMDTPPQAHTSNADPPSGQEVDWMRALDKHRSSLRALIASKLNGEDKAAIEDVMQEVAIAAQAVGERSVEPSRVGAWLRQVAIYKVQDHWRGKGRRQRLLSEFADGGDPGAEPIRSPYEWVVRLEQGQSVAEALRGLPEEDRALLEQKYLHGRNYDEIARAHGISVKALEYRLSRARAAMRRQLEPHSEG